MNDFSINLKDLKFNKQATERSYAEDGVHDTQESQDERGWTATMELVNRRTNVYTAEEAKDIIGSSWTSHNQCVVDNPSDFSNVEVYQAEKKYKRIDLLMDKIDKLQANHDAEIADIPNQWRGLPVGTELRWKGGNQDVRVWIMTIQAFVDGDVVLRDDEGNTMKLPDFFHFAEDYEIQFNTNTNKQKL